MRSRKDPQQQAVYRWEGEWKDWNRSNATLPELRQVIAWACKRYGIDKVPTVVQHHNGDYAWSVTPEEGRPAISMQHKGQKNVPTALHEAAHVICSLVFGNDIPDHGTEWLGIYMALLQDARVAPAKALHATALAHGLKWLKYSVVGPRAFKKRASL
jgi:hypothetical protein